MMENKVFSIIFTLILAATLVALYAQDVPTTPGSITDVNSNDTNELLDVQTSALENPMDAENSSQNGSSDIIDALISIQPKTLNQNSSGNWITCYIELPEEYNASNINISTILLNGELSPVLDTQYGFVTNESEYLNDTDDNKVAERMVKFYRAPVQHLLPVGDNVTITITGQLDTGESFSGNDTIRVINPPYKEKNKHFKDNGNNTNKSGPEHDHEVDDEYDHEGEFNGNGSIPDQDDDVSNNSNPNNTTILRIKLSPSNLNLNSNGNWITCNIEFSPGYNASWFNRSTVRLNGNLSPVLDPAYGFALNESEYIEYESENGTQTLLLKFDRQALQDMVMNSSAFNETDKFDFEIVITGEISGNPFEWTTTIRVINNDVDE